MTNSKQIAKELEATRFLKPEARAKYFKNPLLVKPQTGQGKRSCYDLPDSKTFVYGKKNKPDKEGAGAVILTWKPSTADENSVEKQRYLYEKNKPNLPSNLDNEASFGIKSVYAETAKDLINYKFELDWAKSQEDQMKIKKQLNQARKEKQKSINDQATQRREIALTKQLLKKNASPKTNNKGEFGVPPSTEGLYKMKRFTQIPSKIVVHGLPENLNTTNIIQKKKESSGNEQLSVHSAVSHTSNRNVEEAYDEHPDDESFVSELRDDISIHSSVSQRKAF